MFVANVKPLLQTNCNTCHVGANPTAGLAFDATPDAQLCLNALSEVNTVTVANSNMLKKPDGSANGDAGPSQENKSVHCLSDGSDQLDQRGKVGATDHA